MYGHFFEIDVLICKDVVVCVLLLYHHRFEIRPQLIANFNKITNTLI